MEATQKLKHDGYDANNEGNVRRPTTIRASAQGVQGTTTRQGDNDKIYYGFILEDVEWIYYIRTKFFLDLRHLNLNANN